MLGMFLNITALGSPTVITLVTAMAVFYLVVAGRRTTAILVFLSISLGSTIEKAMKLLFDRTRPDVVPHLVDVHSLSFPSGHAMLSAIACLTLAAYLAKAQAKWKDESIRPWNRRVHDAPDRRQPCLSRGALADRRARRLDRRIDLGVRYMVGGPVARRAKYRDDAS